MRVLLLFGILLACEEAHASCGIPVWIGTAGDTAVPFVGSLFIYDESLRWASDEKRPPTTEVTWDGEPGTVTVTRIGETVARLDYAGFIGTTMKVHVRQAGKTLSYHLIDHW